MGWRNLSGSSKKILSMSRELTNREVADLTGYSLDVVKSVRQHHQVDYKKIPANRGYADKIAALPLSMRAEDVAKQVKCSKSHVWLVRRQMKQNGEMLCQK